MTCKAFQDELPEILLSTSADSGTRPNAADLAHLKICPPCLQEYNSYKSSFAMLEEWEAPEPTPYFDGKLAARVREEQTAPPMSWFERLRSRFLFNTGRQFRPALAGGLALALIAAGGGTAANFKFAFPNHVEASATVNDLQILDRNEQALQQMDQLLQEDDNGTGATDDGAAPAQPVS